jgi:hypothetical protein
MHLERKRVSSIAERRASMPKVAKERPEFF